jgi:hypothetical protein
LGYLIQTYWYGGLMRSFIMAEVFVQNLRDPSQRIGIMVTIKRMLVQQEGTGTQLWVIQASTKELDSEGNTITPVYKWTSNQMTFTDDVNELIDSLCKKVNWVYYPDTTPPEVISHWPMSNDTSIPVDSQIVINIGEELPSSGLDLNSIKVKIKGFDLTAQVAIKGNINSCSVYITPGTKYQSAVNEDFTNGSERSVN